MTISFPLPTPYGFGKVIARYITAIADTVNDPDPYPEAMGSTGSIKFQPQTLNKVILDPDGENVHVTHTTVTANLNSKGRLVDSEGREGIWLIADTYKVEVNVPGVTAKSMTIVVTPDRDNDNPIDLIATMPPESQPGDTLIVVEVPPSPGEDTALAWRDDKLTWIPRTEIIGPAGDTGPAPVTSWAGTALVVDGVTGPDLKGPKGDTAYETAVAEGFVGTEAEWLASLVGPEGPEGPEGPQGKRGPSGVVDYTVVQQYEQQASDHASAADGSATDAANAATSAGVARDAAQAAQTATENALPAFEQAIADALDILIGEI